MVYHIDLDVIIVYHIEEKQQKTKGKKIYFIPFF